MKPFRLFLASGLATMVACAVVSREGSGDKASQHAGNTFAASSALCAAQAGSVLDSAMHASYDFFADQLLVMSDVRLCPRTAGVEEAYRFHWMRAFDHPVLVTVNHIARTTRIRYKEWDGAGGYRLGRLIVDTTVDLRDAQWRMLTNLASAMGLWADAGQNSHVVAGIDGATWSVEGVRNSKYGFICAHSPNATNDHPEIRTFGVAMLSAAGRLPTRHLY